MKSLPASDVSKRRGDRLVDADDRIAGTVHREFFPTTSRFGKNLSATLCESDNDARRRGDVFRVDLAPRAQRQASRLGIRHLSVADRVVIARRSVSDFPRARPRSVATSRDLTPEVGGRRAPRRCNAIARAAG